MRKSVILCLAVTLFFSATLINAQTDLLKALQYRSIGPYRGGRSAAVAGVPSQPYTICGGMGRSPIRGNVSRGDGVYKSTDAGKTWKRIGLEDTSQIARIRIHPKNPDLVYVAALGHVWGPKAERGV